MTSKEHFHIPPENIIAIDQYYYDGRRRWSGSVSVWYRSTDPYSAAAVATRMRRETAEQIIRNHGLLNISASENEIDAINPAFFVAALPLTPTAAFNGRANLILRADLRDEIMEDFEIPFAAHDRDLDQRLPGWITLETRNGLCKIAPWVFAQSFVASSNSDFSSYPAISAPELAAAQ